MKSESDSKDLKDVTGKNSSPNVNAKENPDGTDPDRYKYISSGRDEASDFKDASDYDKKPKNHTDTDERLLNPKRGE